MENLSQSEKVVWSCWTSKTPREVVREAAAKGAYIKLAYKYLMHIHSWDQQTAEQWFLSEVYTWVLLLLTNQQFHKASHVLNKVQIPSDRYILQIAKESPKISFRDYLIEQLTKTAKDLQKNSPEEWKSFCQHWNLLKVLEKSFYVNSIFQNKALGSGKDLVIVNETEIRGLTIDKIEKYPSEWKFKVAVSLFFDSFDPSLTDFIEPKQVWHYLNQNKKTFLLSHWLTTHYSHFCGSTTIEDSFINEDVSFQNIKEMDAKNLTTESFTSLNTMLTSWKLENHMLDSFNDFNHYVITKDIIEMILSCFGVVRDATDLRIFLERLTIAGNVHKTNEIIRLDGSSIKTGEYYNLLFDYCDKNDLLLLLNYVIDDEAIVDDSSAHRLQSFWHSLKTFFGDVKNYVNLANAAYKTCEILSEDVSSYLYDNPVLLVAIILFSHEGNVFDIFRESSLNILSKYHIELSRNLAEKLPHMHSFYRTYDNPNFEYEQDINVYDLLMDDGVFDVQQLFQYRFNEECEGEECDDDEAPYFPKKKLMEMYGLNFRFSHKVYVNQGQMSMASRVLMSEENIESAMSSIINNINVELLQQWHNPADVTPHLTFLAMIGDDPSLYRLIISTSNTIFTYLKDSANIDDVTQVQDDITKQLTDLFDNKSDAIEKLASLLTEATIYNLSKKDENLIDSIREWHLPAMFAKEYSLSLPDKPMKKFATSDKWFPFLLYADVFLYSESEIIQHLQDFSSPTLSLHLSNIIRYIEEARVDENSPNSSRDRTHSMSSSYEAPKAIICHDLWEILANCHGPEDPPGELIKASHELNNPLLSLIALCYEPNAVGICWANWICAGLENELSKEVREELQWDISDQNTLEHQFSDLIRNCVEFGRVKTLYESFSIFFPNCCLLYVSEFVYLTSELLKFDDSTTNLLRLFKIEWNKSISKHNEIHVIPLMRPSFIREAAISMVLTNLYHNFTNPVHQLEYLNALCDAEFETGLNVQCTQFSKVKSFVKLSIESVIPLNLKNIFDEKIGQVTASDFVDKLIAKKLYSEARKFVEFANIPIDKILLAEFCDQYEKDTFTDLDEKARFHICIQNLDSLKKADVKFESVSPFIKKIASGMVVEKYKFYLYRLLYLWTDLVKHNAEYEDQLCIENDMWNMYFLCDVFDVYLGDYDSTIKSIHTLNFVPPKHRFCMLLSEIEFNSAITTKKQTIAIENVKKWLKAISLLLESNRVVEAWRLSELFQFPEEYIGRGIRRLKTLKTCLMLAEKTMSPYEIPADVRLVMARSVRSKLESEDSDNASVDEITVEKMGEDDNVSVCDNYLEGDCLAAIESLATRVNCPIGKQLIDYLKICNAIRWSYSDVLKYSGDPLELINFVTGKPRFFLARSVFRVFNVSSIKVAEYLCNEFVAAIIAPHLTKTAGFNQKHHFQYTLWGFDLDSDLEMFINMVPNACPALGELLIDHFTALRSIYKCNSIEELDDGDLDVEAIIDEEYQNVDESDVQSALDDINTIDQLSFEYESIYSASERNIEIQLLKRDENTLFDIIDGRTHIPNHVKLNIKRITRGLKLAPKQVSIISIEMMIIGHGCFTAASDVEGIAVILRSAQVLSSRLLATKSWRLLVRLLTGIGRYTEMAYIFKMMQENHQFEFLLGQFDYMLGHKDLKIFDFKQGLLEYLTTFCPHDEDTYCMVALHFSMYSEAAFVKRKQMFKAIYALQKKPSEASPVKKSIKGSKRQLSILENCPHTTSLLEEALNCCYDAAELLLQDGKLISADESAKMAQQIALQMSLLIDKPNSVCIIDLNKEDILLAISKHLSFTQGMIFADTTNMIDHWFDIVYHKVLMAKDEDFLHELVTWRLDIVDNILKRYETEKKVTRESENVIEILASFLY